MREAPHQDTEQAMRQPLLEVRNLKIHFQTERGLVKAVNGISFDLYEGETMALVGESGSGKTVSCLSILRLIPTPPGKIVDGEIIFEGRNLLRLSEAEIRQVGGNQVAMIFQEPMTSLNPVITIGAQIAETLKCHLKLSSKDAQRRCVSLLKKVQIPEAHSRVNAYPYEFSGGMRQRAMIAMGLGCHPKLIIADEPTTALDVTIQAQILELMKRLTEESGMAQILITHNLGIVARYAERINVMYAGRIVEKATVMDLYTYPRHPYTIGLLASVPRLDLIPKKKLAPIPGQPPDPMHLSHGCAFHPRCQYAYGRCREGVPPELVPVDDNHEVACWVDVTKR